MCFAVALARSELPVPLLDAYPERVYTRDGGGEPEVRFLWRASPTLLPVWWGGRLHVVRWGSKSRKGPLPYGGWTWEASVKAGRWGQTRAEPVDVPGSYLWAGGVWTRVRHGCRALLVRDPADGDKPVVYVICRPSTRYYRVMTRCEFQPVLIGEVI